MRTPNTDSRLCVKTRGKTLNFEEGGKRKRADRCVLPPSSMGGYFTGMGTLVPAKYLCVQFSQFQGRVFHRHGY